MNIYCSISLPIRLPLLNVQLRTHWAKRRKQLEELAWLVKAELAAKRIAIPRKTIARADIRILRFSPNAPDYDNLQASAKGLLDVLQPLSRSHPCGLGIIANDSPDCVTVTVDHFGARVRRTDITIEDVSP